MFAPTAMRIHPVFTQVRDWTNDGRPDGIEVLVEFQDRFGDPVKASGQALFEVYAFRQGSPDPRGARLVEPFVANIDNVASQRDHWNRTSRCYSFQLAWPVVRQNEAYVLTASFQLEGGGRFTDQLVLKPMAKEIRSEHTEQFIPVPTTGPVESTPEP